MRTNGHRPGPAPPARAPAALADVAGRQLRRVQALLLTLGGLLVLTIAALAISVVALNRDIDAVARAAPRDDSVATSALRDGAVTSPKLAAGAVATGRIADGAVTGAKVARDSLTGSQIDESTLTPVARATHAGRPTVPATRRCSGALRPRATSAPSPRCGLRLRPAPWPSRVR